MSDEQEKPKERVFEKDKVYLRDKNSGIIWEYEPLLAKLEEQFEKVIPNPTTVVQTPKK